MRIAFIDTIGWSYTPNTPYERPFGGSQSALCYLTAELAALGHSVSILNASPEPAEVRGVRVMNISALASREFLNQTDIAVVLNRAAATKLRQNFRVEFPLVLWTQHAHTEVDVQELRQLRERKSWNGFAFVSEWQMRHYLQEFWVPAEKSRVMRNAASPVFLGSPQTAPWFRTGANPVLYYSSTPFRGLEILLMAFPQIRSAIPGVELRIYSSMAVYQVASNADGFQSLYAQAKSMDSVHYVGSVGQKQLVHELAGAAALAYPSVFAETSCITAMEALAAGAAIFTTSYGALPETTAGFAAMVDWQFDKERLIRDFTSMIVESLRQMKEQPELAEAQRSSRVEFAKTNYSWPRRALEWSEWLGQVQQGR